jgi:Ca2+-binding RTX toxin-like protein
LILFAVALATLALPAIAHAGGIVTQDADATYFTGDVSGTGTQINDAVTATPDAGAVLLSNEGGLVSPDCIPVDANTASCDPRPQLQFAFNVGDDELTLGGAFPGVAILAEGGPGADTLRGGGAAGNSVTLRGGPDNDQLIGGPGADSFYGDDGSDTIFARDGFAEVIY